MYIERERKGLFPLLLSPELTGRDLEGGCGKTPYFLLVFVRIPSFLGNISFHSLRSSVDWMRPTYIIKNNLLYLKSSDIYKTPSGNIISSA